MSTFINTVVVGVSSFVVVVSVLWSATSNRPAGEIELDRVEPTWHVEADEVHLWTNVVVTNPGRVKSDLVRADWTLTTPEGAVKDAFVRRLPVLPGTATVFTLKSTLPSASTESWIRSFVLGDGTWTMDVEGSLTILQGPDEKRVPFSRRVTGTGALWGPPLSFVPACEAQVPVCANVLPGPTGRTQTGWVLPASTWLGEQRGQPSRVVDLRAELRLSQTVVAVGSWPEPVDLGPGEERAVEMPFEWDMTAAKTWWRNHLGACESSDVEIGVSYAVVPEGNLTAEKDAYVVRLSAAPLRTGFLCPA